MKLKRLYKGLGTAGLGVAVTAALLRFGGVVPEDDLEVRMPDAFPPGVEIPALPELVREAGLSGDLSSEMERWARSWTEGGDTLRLEVYEEISPALADRLTVAQLEAELERIRAAVAEASHFDRAFLPEGLVQGLEQATRLEAEARRLLEQGRTDDALARMLAASDALRTVEPRQVAEELTGRAEAALARVQDGAVYSEQEARRGERLAIGAREALDDGEYTRAIQRAYYACQLLESRGT